MTTCQTCAHWQLRDSMGKQLPMAKHGLGACALGTRWTYFPPQHTCPKHKAADADVTAARAKWLNKK